MRLCDAAQAMPCQYIVPCERCGRKQCRVARTRQQGATQDATRRISTVRLCHAEDAGGGSAACRMRRVSAASAQRERQTT